MRQHKSSPELVFVVGATYYILTDRIQGQKEPLDNLSLTLCVSQATVTLSSHSFTEWNVLDLTEYDLHSIVHEFFSLAPIHWRQMCIICNSV